MQLRLIAAAAALLLLPLAACDSSGGATPGTTTPGAEESAFDDYFGFGDGALAANDSTTGTAEQCADDNCTSGTPTDPMPEYTPPVCESPLAPPAGGLAACQAFCAKVTGCMGQPEAEAACASDCNASLAGMELAAVQQIFGCFTAASCDDIAAWSGGASDTTQGGTGEDVPGTDASGADGGTETPVPADGSSSDPIPSEEGTGEVVVTANPIGECVEGVFTGWFDASISASKQAICDAVPANEARCAGSGGTTVVEVSSGEASSNSTPDGEAGASGGSDASSGSSDQAPAQEDPFPTEEEPTAEDYADAAVECRAYGSLLSAQTMTRIGACDAMEDCAARDACLEQVLVCAPFIEVLYFGGGARVSDDVGDTNTANPEPATPTDPDPEPTPR